MGIDRVLDKNLAAAYEYFEAAMKTGNTDAYVHLSNMYEKGIYVKKDEKLASELLMMAAMKKNQTAIYILNEKVNYRVN
jgi:TPR repeat protein